MRLISMVLVSTVILAGIAWAGESPPAPFVVVERDFVADFDSERVVNSQAASASQVECSNNVSLPGIFLHPMNADDAAIVYPDVAIPAQHPDYRCFLVFRIGFRDNVPWDSEEHRPNGVRFMVAVDDTVVFSEAHTGVGWQARAIDMGLWAGKRTTVELRTNAIEGNTNYDWAMFGAPLLVRIPDAKRRPVQQESIGLALAEVTCAEPSIVTVRVGLIKEKVRLDAGAHWVPVDYVFFSDPVLDVEQGSALLTGSVAAPYAPKLSKPALSLSTPLVTVGRPFGLLYEVRNAGKGIYDKGETIVLRSLRGGTRADLGPNARRSRQLRRVAPGESESLRWEGLEADAPGDWVVTAGDTEVAFHAFPEAPATSPDQVTAPQVTVTPGEPVAATVATAGARLCFLVDDEDDAYAIAETWDGTQWQRVASLYPLASVAVRDTSQPLVSDALLEGLEPLRDTQQGLTRELKGLEFVNRAFVLFSLDSRSAGRPAGVSVTLDVGQTLTAAQVQTVIDQVAGFGGLGFHAGNIRIETTDGDVLHEPEAAADAAPDVAMVGASRALGVRVQSLEAVDRALVVHATAGDKSDWHLTLTFTPEAGAPRIAVTSELTAAADAPLLSFYAPTVLAGDRAFGVEKDFAIFPGIEYLEGKEHSSSERDLAYPLSDRRVPAIHKPATPLMAVQGDDALVALLWDANQAWAENERHPAARFLAPQFDSGYDYIHMALFAPSVGTYVEENEYQAEKQPYPLEAGQTLRLEAVLALDHKARYAADSMVQGPHRGGLVLQAMQHWFDVFGFPEPSPQPRPWDEERALCRQAYLDAVWSEDPPGWSHCHGWSPGPLVGHAVPCTLDLRAGVPEPARIELQRRIDLVIERALSEHGPHYLSSNAGCHIMMAELPFYYGYLAEAMRDFRQQGFNSLEGRERGLWVWHPRGEKYESLGRAGDHTLGQASAPSFRALRAARMTGDPELTRQALEAMKQMERYDVPRGAQTWECPLYQPDILAAGQAIRAYCEAYRITGDPAHLAHARYWAWTGLPFLYMWDLDGYPTMRYNVIAVIGSTFYRHSWIGLPVVWCGLVYAYGLQDLAEFDESFDWRRVAQGITNSTMWQQYTDGPSKGTYPDSWNMVKNKPNPADINPENILVNEFRLRGRSPEIRCARFQGEDKVVMLNSSADLVEPRLDPSDGSIRFALQSAVECTAYSLLAAVPEPTTVSGAGERVDDSDALQQVEAGWMYDAALSGVVFKHRVGPDACPCEVHW